MHLVVADYAVLSDLTLAGFELRFDERHKRRFCFRKIEHRREEFGERDKRSVDRCEIYWIGQRLQISRVGAIHDDHTGIVAELESDLSVADIDREDFGRAAL